MNFRILLAVAPLLATACSTATGGGGGGGAVTYVAGAACTASITTDQCGASAAHAAIVHCTSNVWTVVKDCGTGASCGVKGGVASCTVSSTGADASGDDGFAFDAVTQPTDVQNGQTDANVADTPLLPDIPKDIGKDIGKDIAKPDIQPQDTGPIGPTWGTCTLNDTACLQGCIQSSCMDANQACANNSDCASYIKCQQGCSATPIQMPVQSGTPIPQNGGETQVDYCYRVCAAQASGPAVALNQAYLTCVIGLCVDCNSSASSGITMAQCQTSCGEEANCLTQYNNCLGDTDCLGAFGCLLKCAAGDTTCENDCINNASGQGPSLFSAFNTCVNNNATICVAP